MTKKRDKSAAGTAQNAPKRKKPKLGLHVVFTILVMSDILAVVIISSIISAIFKKLFEYTIDLPVFAWLLIFSLTIGIVVTAFIGKSFLEPVTKLSRAMSKVAKGDFSVRISNKSSYKELEDICESFNLMASELSATEVLQTDFVSNVSHEFKTPINAIEGYATLLQGSAEVSEQEKEYVDKILFNTKRLSTLVGNILLLSKVDNQVIQSKKEAFSLDEQIRQAIISLEADWSKKNIDFDVDMQSVEYVGTEGLMIHVWTNLIGNAIKFDPQDGIIKIKLFKDGSSNIIFTIEDNGPGISENAMKHIFDRFYQADSSHKEEGNGLGLALVSRILAMCRGKIDVENILSDDGAVKGCKFTVTIPA